MASHSRRPTLRVDDDGVRVVSDGGVRRIVQLAGAAALVVVVGTVVVLMAIRRTPASPPGETARTAASAPATPGTPVPPAAAPVPSAAPTPAPSPGRALAIARRRDAASPPPSAPTTPGMSGKDAILALRAAGEQGGIAAFGLPGTDPVQPGVIVPDDFELPPGYLRHVQTTDEGETLPPVLKLHPDYELVDAQGKPVALPESRIVPPELAPPGLPIRMLDVPGAAGGAGTRP